MEKEEIQALAAKAQTGDLDSFTLLVTHFEKILLRYIFRLSNISYEESEEILQESFLHAWRYIKEYSPDYSFSSWIYRIAHQKTISYHRKEVSRGKENKVAWDDSFGEIIASDLNIEKKLEISELQTEVQKAVSHLPTDQKNVIILKYLEQKSYEEISDILHIPVGTAGSLASRGKKMLKRFLSSYGETE